MSSPQLFNPISVGPINLQHRVVLSPMTRYRATKEHVPVVPLVGKYYSQRGSLPGTLLITEATFISPQAGGYDYIPGIWSPEQIAAWKQVTDQVHKKNSFIYLQLWALGRAATPSVLKTDGYDYVAPSSVGIYPDEAPPRELTVAELGEYTQWYIRAARNAVTAGFDGVEIHNANGYLLHQFLEDHSNQRTDKYGGSVENRSRFPLEVAKAVVDAIGEERVGLRLSPWNKYQEMGMSDPLPQYTHFVSALKAAHPNLAYIHVVEPDFDRLAPEAADKESNDFIRKIWAPRPLISANGYDAATAIARAEEHNNELIAFGKWFISNPDLPTKILKKVDFTPFDGNTFYVNGDQPTANLGYIDYPFSEVAVRAHSEL